MPQQQANPQRSTHYKLEVTTETDFYNFLQALYPLCSGGGYFRAGIGIIYLTVIGSNNPDALDDLWFSYGPNGIRVMRVLCRKPRPERTYMGQWISLQQWKEQLSTAGKSQG